MGLPLGIFRLLFTLVMLALRLAVGTLLLGEQTPLVLDDALVSFDDARLRQALRLLRQRAEQCQILLFTCQSREQQALQELEAQA